MSSNIEMRIVSKAVRDRDLRPMLDRGVKTDWFQDPQAKEVWEVATEHWAKYGEVPTPVAVKDTLPDVSLLRVEDAYEYILDEFVAWRRRGLVIQLLQAGAKEIEGEDHEQALAVLSTGLTKVAEVGASAERDQDLTQTVDDRIDEYVALKALPGGMRGIPTGFPTIDLATSGLQAGQLVTIVAQPKCGKALDPEEDVLTPLGWFKHKDLQPGDSVIGSNGLPTAVVAVQDWSDRPRYAVTLDDGTVIIADAEHDWSVLPHGGTPQTVSTSALRDRIARNPRFGMLPVVAPVHFTPHRPLDVDPYLLGLLLGDGGLASGSSPTLTTADAEIISAAAAALPSTMLVKPTGSPYGYRLVARQRTNSKSALASALSAMGLLGKRSWEKYVPDNYLMSSIEDRKSLLAGLLDSDGGVDGKRVSFTTTSPVLAEHVVHLVGSLGGCARVSSRRRAYTHLGVKKVGRESYTVTLRVPYGSPFRLSRKTEAYVAKSDVSRPPTRRVVSVEPHSTGPTRCIQVEASDGLYVTRNFAVTHNSTLTVAFAKNIHLKNVGTMLISFEMSNDEQAARYDAMLAGISHTRLMRGEMTTRDEELLRRHLNNTKDLAPLHLIQDPVTASTVSGVAAKIEKYKPQVLFIDGVYLMIDEISGEQNTPQALTNITRNLKRLAQRYQIPVVISTQALTWKMSAKKGVTANSIGYSSSFFQDSDVILGLQFVDEDEDPTERLLKVVASRNCPNVETTLMWDWEEARFEEVDDQ